MKITLKSNAGPDKQTIPYIARIEIVEATVDYNTIFEVPVHVSASGEDSVYDIEIAGFRVETDNTDYIAEMAEKLLSGLINMARVPSYVFIARRSREIYPVYTVGNEVFATTPGGPLFRHVELAKVRDYLSDYLHAVGVLGVPGKSDKLHVRGVNTKTLGLMRPVFYLKKRIPGQTDFWAPVFESRDGKRIYAYAANERREVEIDNGNEVFALHELVANALINDKRLNNIYDLRPDRLMPAYWERLEASLPPSTDSISLAGAEMRIYCKDTTCLAVETRPDENRFSLFLGKDKTMVQQRAVQDFERRGLLEKTLA